MIQLGFSISKIYFCCRLLTFFKNKLFKILSGPILECQTAWMDQDQDRFSVEPYRVQTVCKGYKQMVKVAASLERTIELLFCVAIRQEKKLRKWYKYC